MSSQKLVLDFPSPNGKRILLVEDDRYLRLACAAGLPQAGFTVLTAEDSERALAEAAGPRGAEDPAVGYWVKSKSSSGGTLRPQELLEVGHEVLPAGPAAAARATRSMRS